MQLFYSGARSANSLQPYSWLSLGGYISSSPIKNGVKNSFFNDISLGDIKEKKTVYRLVVIKNTTTGVVSNVKIYIEKNIDCVSKFEGALVEPAEDACENQVFEIIQNENEIPFNAEFTNCETLANALTIPSLAVNASIGIWLKMSIDDTNSNYFDSGNFKLDTCKVLFDSMEDANNFYNKKVDEFSVKITY